jgi:LruC domain-containing protein
MSPTNLVNSNLFGTGQDDSNSGIYYKSKNNLPWALDIPTDFDYDIEKADITQTYLKFSQWVQSNGTQYQDWYLDKPGYRNTSNIY